MAAHTQHSPQPYLTGPGHQGSSSPWLTTVHCLYVSQSLLHVTPPPVEAVKVVTQEPSA